MIQVLALVRPHGHARLRAAIEQAVALGCADAAAIRHLITAADLVRAGSEIIELGAATRPRSPYPAGAAGSAPATRQLRPRRQLS
jgi:hypothetical protein